jgi:putative transposase
MDDAEDDVLAYMAFPSQRRTKLHSTNPLERLNKEVKRRADVVGIFPNEDRILRLTGAVLLEANDEWRLQHRYMQIEGMAELNPQAAEEEKPLQIIESRLIMTARFHIRDCINLTDAIRDHETWPALPWPPAS